MNIKETFINLTSQTYPHGTEQELFDKLPTNLQKDEFGNLFIQIGENPSCMFTSHLDTASHEKNFVNHIFEGNIIKTDGNSILGADDKAGVTIMLYMMENNVPGLYYFFLGEERGCIGSKKVADKHRKEPLNNIKKVISFDRRGTNSIITFQSSSRCCSESFAIQLADQINEKSRIEKSIDLEFDYKLDPTGIYTDSYQFTSIYPECTNISVGYQFEHTKRESQDILHLEKLAKTCVLINWEDLVSERNPAVEEPERNFYQDLDWEYPYQSITKKPTLKRHWFVDTEHDRFISLVETDTVGRVQNFDVSPKRKAKEHKIITDFLSDLGLGIEKLEWDGLTLICKHKASHGGHITEVDRHELEEHIIELREWRKLVRN
jgi:hypothetical protein